MQKGKVTVQREKKRDEINKLHEKTFRAWVNAQLKKKKANETLPKDNLFDSFEDGIALIKLLSILSGESHPKYNLHPKMEVQCVENCTIAVDFASRVTEGKIGISGEGVKNE